MNQDFLKGKWTEIKGEIQKQWGKLTGDELEQTKGDSKAVVGLLRQKYGLKQEDAQSKIGQIYGKYQEAKEDLKKSAAETAENAKENMRNSVREDEETRH